MLFNSQLFIIVFLPISLLLYYSFSEIKSARQIVLVLSSLVFYGWWDFRFVPVLFGLAFVTYYISYFYNKTGIKILPALGIVINLFVLFFFKYFNFFSENISNLLGYSFQSWSIILPLGLSFFAFQKISYLIDLKRGNRPIYSFLDFTLFVSFFPQLIAGPLVRHNEIVQQFSQSPRRPKMWESLGCGFVLFLIGVVKKVAIADTMALVCDPLFQKAASGSLQSPGEAWIAAITYSIQIYFDFSGYSDMAIGLGLMFGLKMPFNFDSPYKSLSIREFWRRWHMTLSRFLRDYLYIPMGGSRCGHFRQARNVVVTMLLGGLWHGASWTFVAWGGLHGLALALNNAWSRAGLRLPAAVAWLLTMLFIIFTWILFRAPDFSTAWYILQEMLSLSSWQAISNDTIRLDGILVTIFAFCISTFGPSSQELVLKKIKPSPYLAVFLGFVMIWSLALMGGRVPNTFIYFQF